MILPSLSLSPGHRSASSNGRPSLGIILTKFHSWLYDKAKNTLYLTLLCINAQSTLETNTHLMFPGKFRWNHHRGLLLKSHWSNHLKIQMENIFCNDYFCLQEVTGVSIWWSLTLHVTGVHTFPPVPLHQTSVCSWWPQVWSCLLSHGNNIFRCLIASKTYVE